MNNLQNLKRILLFAITLFAVDQIFFGFLIWRLPNESPWGTNHFFNFIYEKKRIERTPRVNPRILIIGSSIAYYSIDRDLLKGYLKEKTNTEFDIEYLSYAGMTPLDSFLLREDIDKLKPDLVLYPINFIDLRLHRAYVLHPNGTNERIDDKVLLLDALNFVEAPQSKFTFPEKTIQEFYKILPLEKRIFTTTDSEEIQVIMDMQVYKFQNESIHLVGLGNNFHLYLNLICLKKDFGFKLFLKF